MQGEDTREAVIRLAAAGLNSRAIGEALGLSQATVVKLRHAIATAGSTPPLSPRQRLAGAEDRLLEAMADLQDAAEAGDAQECRRCYARLQWLVPRCVEALAAFTNTPDTTPNLGVAGGVPVRRVLVD